MSNSDEMQTEESNSTLNKILNLAEDVKALFAFFSYIFDFNVFV